MKIVVLMKQVPDTWGERRLDPETGWVARDATDKVVDEISERALEVALAMKDRDKSVEVVLLCMGPSSATDILRRGLAMGADSAMLVSDPAIQGADLTVTAAVLTAAIRKIGFDLIIAGNESTDGRGGVIPSMVAEHLGIRSLTALDSVEMGAVVRGVRTTENGSFTAHAALPAVISVTERTPEARFPSFKGVLTSKRKPLTVTTASELGVEVSRRASVIHGVQARPARIAGQKVTDNGNGGEEIAAFLATNRLI